MNKESLVQVEPIIEDYYAEELDTSKLDPSEDGELVHTLVHNFVKRQKYESHIGALQDVTPRQWRAQVNKAAIDLEAELHALLESWEHRLHVGEFAPKDR